MRLCIPLLLLLVSIPAIGQAPETLTLEESMALAAREALTVQRAAVDVETRRATLAQRRLDRLPSLSLSLAAQQRHGLAFDETVGRLTQTTTEFGSGGISTVLTLFDAGATRAAVTGAAASLAHSEWEQARVAAVAASEALELFLDAVAFAAERDISEAELEAQRTHLAMVEAQIEVGARPPSEVYLQEERMAAAEVQALQRNRQFQVARMRLLAFLGLDPAADFTLVPPQPVPYADAADADALVLRAIAQRPEVRATREVIRMAEAEVTQARASYWPRLSLSAGAATSFSSSSPIEFSDQVFDNRSGVLGLNLAFPLSQVGVAPSRTRTAESRLRLRRLEVENLERLISAEVRTALLDVSLRREETGAAERRLRAAEAALEAERERYRLGLSELTSLADAQARHTEAAVAHTRAHYAIIGGMAMVRLRVGDSLLHHRTGPVIPYFSGREPLSGRDTR